MTKEPNPSLNATNALQSLPFGNSIGGPLKACMEAQNEQAKKDWQVIEELRLHDKETKDK